MYGIVIGQLIIYAVAWIITLVIAYYLIKAAVRDGMMEAWKSRAQIRKAKREASGDFADMTSDQLTRRAFDESIAREHRDEAMRELDRRSVVD